MDVGEVEAILVFCAADVTNSQPVELRLDLELFFIIEDVFDVWMHRRESNVTVRLCQRRPRNLRKSY
jgi:hypothetical protein